MQFLHTRMSLVNDCHVQTKLDNVRLIQVHKLSGLYMKVQVVVSLKCPASYST
jgi:hypothetical protein